MPFGTPGFGETPPQQPAPKIETYQTNPELLEKQVFETLPAFLGYVETPELETLRTTIIEEGEQASRDDFVRNLNSYLIASDEMICAILSDEDRILAHIGQMLTEALLYRAFGEQEQMVLCLEQAEQEAQGTTHSELAAAIAAI